MSTIGWGQSENSLTRIEVDSLLSKLYRGHYFEQQYIISQEMIKIQNEHIFELEQKDSLNYLLFEKQESTYQEREKAKAFRERGRKIKIGAILFISGVVVGLII